MRVPSAPSVALLILAAAAPACDRAEPNVQRTSAGGQAATAQRPKMRAS